MTSSDIRVLYDISALGPVATNRALYTGVQRVIHEVAVGLAACPEIELTLYADTSLPECVRFVADDAALKRCAFVHSSGQLRQAGWIQALTEKLAKNPSRAFHRRAVRWLGHRTMERLRQRLILRAPQLRAFDVYHTPHFAFPEAVRRSPRTAKFLTVYDLTPIKMPEHSLGIILDAYRQMLASVPADAWVFCISENTKKDWCEYTGTDPDRCFVTPLAAASYFAPCQDAEQIRAVRRQYKIPEGDYFLSVSTLEPRKNLATVIKAFQKLLLESGDRSLYLVLAGRRGWHEEGIFAAVDPAARSQIIFTGYVAEQDLSALYSGALAFLYLSFYEGFGLPPLEAMQCGSPVVTSNNSSLPEVVGSAGILVDATDQNGLCARMQALREDAGWRQQLRRRSLEQARRFSWSACLDRTVNAYRTALAAQ